MCNPSYLTQIFYFTTERMKLLVVDSRFFIYTREHFVCFFFYNTVPVLRVHNGATLLAIMKRNDEAFIELFVIINIMWNIYMKNVYSNRLKVGFVSIYCRLCIILKKETFVSTFKVCKCMFKKLKKSTQFELQFWHDRRRGLCPMQCVRQML